MDDHTKLKSNCVGLVILQWNCNGILAHQNELKKHIVETDRKYDVICLQETFLKSGKKTYLSQDITLSGAIEKKERWCANVN